MSFDPREGKRLRDELHQAYETLCHADPNGDDIDTITGREMRARQTWYEWLRLHGNDLLDAALQLEGSRLQVESRDRTINTLLQTLSETEARLPGITRAP